MKQSLLLVSIFFAFIFVLSATAAPTVFAQMSNLFWRSSDGGQNIYKFPLTGNVGIGTNAPGEKLEVTGNVKLTPTIQGGKSAIFGQPTGGSDFSSYNWLDFKNISGGSVFKVGYYGDTEVATKLAIGTSPSAARLHIGGTSLANPATIRIGSGASGANFQFVGAPQDQLLDLQLDNGASLLAIQSAGNIGIGTTNPSQKLHVVGNTRITGLANCNTIDTDASGNLACGTDETGGGGSIGGGGTANMIPKFTGATTIGDSVMSESSGNVGIGTGAPGYKLDVVGDVRWSGILQDGSVPWARITGFTGDPTPDTIADDGTITLGTETTGSYDNTADTIADDGTIALGTETTGGYDNTPDTIADDGTVSDNEASDILTINNGLLYAPTSGNVGIGTTNPGAKLTVNGPLIRRIARVQGRSEDGTDDGVLAARVLSFTKTQNDTGVRVAWSDNYRVGPNGKSCTWEVRFNDVSCSSPGPLYFSKYDYVSGVAATDSYDPSTFIGTCFGLPAGTYTVQGYVRRYYPADGDCYTGWPGSDGQLFSMEAEEVY